MNTSVLLLFFNRPELSVQILDTIRRAAPKRLFLAADGPRQSVEGEAELCERTRTCVHSRIDWDCEVKKLYREQNLGCREAVSSAISWFFSEVEEGIILEDDTLPMENFFHFAETLLERYRDDRRVMHISGNNHQHGRVRGDGAYYASRFAHSWGWASWQRAWKFYDPDMGGFPEQWDKIANDCVLPDAMRVWWRMALGNVNTGITNTWDFQWHYALMKNNGISLIPNRNLVDNIGVGGAATHMKKKDVASSIRASTMNRLDAPTSLDVCQGADLFDFEHAVLNRRVPWRTPREMIDSMKFSSRRRFSNNS